jgi:hypothetical protein
MVEGVLHLLDDQSKDTFQVAHHIPCGNSKHAQLKLAHETVACCISIWPTAEIMHVSIHFDDEICFADEEVRNVWTERMLAPDLEAELARAQLAPQQSFRRAHVSPKLAGGIDAGFAQRRAPSPHSNPHGPPPPPRAAHIHFYSPAPHPALHKSRTPPL